MVEIFFDGACEPVNPGGTASYGWLIKRNGKIIAQESKIIGSGHGMTNNVAEYTGLIKALTYLKNNPVNEPIHIFGDSNLVCSIVAKKWGWNKKKTQWQPHKDMPHLKQLLDEVLSLLESLKYTITWVPREQNTEADQLSKKALVNRGIITS